MRGVFSKQGRIRCPIILLQRDYKANFAMQVNSSEKMRLRKAYEHSKYLKKTIKGLENEEKVSAAAMNSMIKKKKLKKSI